MYLILFKNIYISATNCDFICITNIGLWIVWIHNNYLLINCVICAVYNKNSNCTVTTVDV